MYLVFALIRAFIWLVLLPFKILWEIAEHSSHHRRHTARRRPASVRRNAPVAPPRSFSPRASGPTGPSHWQSLSGKRKALIIGFPLALVLLIAVGAAMGSPSPAPSSDSSALQAPPTGAAQAAGIAAAPATTPAATPAPTGRHHHHKRRPRRHHRVAPPPAPAPSPTGCYPIASSGNCYRPGEFCPDADAGMTGLAGDGEQIKCEDNNGLRWEPV